MLFFLVALVSGSVFGWLVFENHLLTHNMPGKKYNGYGFTTCVLSFICSGLVLQTKLSAILSKLSFKSQIYVGISIFSIGLTLTYVGAVYTPELLFVAEILLSFSGCQIHITCLQLSHNFKTHSFLMTCAFAISTTLFQFVDLNVPFYVVFIIWFILTLIVALVFNPNYKRVKINQFAFQELQTILKSKQYPIYLSIIFGTGFKSYYGSGYFVRLKDLGINSRNMQFVCTGANFMGIFSFLFEYFRPEWGFVISNIICVVAQVIVLVYQDIYVIALNSVLVNVAISSILSQATKLSNQDFPGVNVVISAAQLLGSLFGLVIGYFLPIQFCDYIVVISASIMQILCVIIFTVTERRNMFTNHKYQRISDNQETQYYSEKLISENEALYTENEYLTTESVDQM
ncbi:Transmembrane_domain-containing protein [Hexamita inflata]|uniref:Transmembrane_domain-containing protein n=1 Tax=Hexamita inflata TaxID=28002 RepID=A0ABP1JFG8_9EUKA